jgi:hypothetical protein
MLSSAIVLESIQQRGFDAMTTARNTIAGWFRPIPTDIVLET